MNETIENLKTRRSIRKFKDEQITDEELKTILEAGTYAPTARGLQSPKIVVIQNPETIKELSAWNRSFFPVDVPDDMDAAHAVGVGSCWIHRAYDEFQSEKGKELLKEWGIPETYEGIGHVVLDILTWKRLSLCLEKRITFSMWIESSLFFLFWN